MDRKNFLGQTAKMGICSCAMMALIPNIINASEPEPNDEAYQQMKQGREFVQNWLSDLLEAMEQQLDRDTQVKLIEHCGKACFNRHQFKKDIAINGKGDIDKLIDAYKNNFNVSREDGYVHIRFGGGKCFCPAAIYRPNKPNDLHCECTRMTHQSIFETALGRPIKVDIIETLRRGGENCHFRVHVS